MREVSLPAPSPMLSSLIDRCVVGWQIARMLTTKVGPDGRVLIPVDVRRAAGLKGGEILVARADGDLVVLEPRAAVLRRLRRRFASVADDISLVDDLIADRRREAERDLE